MPDLSQRDDARILIIKPSSFGDVIHALPVLNGLRRRYRRAKISWLLAHSCAELLDGHPALDEVIRFDRHRYGRMGRSFRVTLEFAQFVRGLRARAFDLVVDLQGLFRSGFLALACGAPVRLGFASAREFAPMFYTRRIQSRNRDMHAVDRNYLFADPLGFADVPITFDLPVKPEARARIQQRLSAEGIEPGAPYVLMGPGTRWETKRWPVENFAMVARELVASRRLPVVLVGMRTEAAMADQVAKLAGPRVTNLAGKTSLEEMVALVDSAATILMHDSGPMHLASALNKPMVAIYGPTNPQRTGPYRRPETIARLDLPCSPCYIKKVVDCPHQHQCMRKLSPEIVSAKVEQALTTTTGAS